MYTIQTKRDLTIKSVRGLENAGGSSTGRMVVYRSSPDVVKMHIPMRHRFLAAMQRAVANATEVLQIFALKWVNNGPSQYITSNL